jgi:hypothetical protein
VSRTGAEVEPGLSRASKSGAGSRGARGARASRFRWCYTLYDIIIPVDSTIAHAGAHLRIKHKIYKQGTEPRAADFPFFIFETVFYEIEDGF